MHVLVVGRTGLPLDLDAGVEVVGIVGGRIRERPRNGDQFPVAVEVLENTVAVAIGHVEQVLQPGARLAIPVEQAAKLGLAPPPLVEGGQHRQIPDRAARMSVFVEVVAIHGRSWSASRPRGRAVWATEIRRRPDQRRHRRSSRRTDSRSPPHRRDGKARGSRCNRRAFPEAANNGSLRRKYPSPSPSETKPSQSSSR